MASGVVNAGRQFAAVTAIALVAALIHNGQGYTPATLLQAMPGLAGLMGLGVWLAWRLPGIDKETAR